MTTGSTIEIIKTRLRELQLQIKLIRQDKDHVKTYRERLLCDANIAFLIHEHCELLLRLHDLMEDAARHQNEEDLRKISLDF